MKIEDSLVHIIKNTFLDFKGEVQLNFGPNEIPGWDSMGHLNLIMAVNDYFEVNFEFEEVMSIHQISDIIRILKSKLEKE